MLDTSGRAGKARTCTGAAEPAPVRACGACGSSPRDATGRGAGAVEEGGDREAAG